MESEKWVTRADRLKQLIAKRRAAVHADEDCDTKVVVKHEPLLPVTGTKKRKRQITKETDGIQNEHIQAYLAEGTGSNALELQKNKKRKTKVESSKETIPSLADSSESSRVKNETASLEPSKNIKTEKQKKRKPRLSESSEAALDRSKRALKRRRWKDNKSLRPSEPDSEKTKKASKKRTKARKPKVNEDVKPEVVQKDENPLQERGEHSEKTPKKRKKPRKVKADDDVKPEVAGDDVKPVPESAERTEKLPKKRKRTRRHKKEETTVEGKKSTNDSLSARTKSSAQNAAVKEEGDVPDSRSSAVKRKKKNRSKRKRNGLDVTQVEQIHANFRGSNLNSIAGYFNY